ncbi:unnamed protein product [Malus baccata var. baccata]
MGRSSSIEDLSCSAVPLLWHDLREMAIRVFRSSVVTSSTKKSVIALVGGGGSCATMAAYVIKSRSSPDLFCEDFRNL